MPPCRRISRHVRLPARRGNIAATHYRAIHTWDARPRIAPIEQPEQQRGNPAAEERIVFAYNALGHFTLIRRHNDLGGQPGNLAAESTVSYAALARLVELQHAYNGGSTAYAWAYDTGHRVVSFVSPQGTSLYTYGQTSQLLLADHDYQPEGRHQFDANGNRTTTS